MTATDATADGHLSVYPTGTPLPRTSAVNFAKGETVANQSVVTVGTSDGHPSITISNGQKPGGGVDVIVDVTGVIDDGTQPDGMRFRSFAPIRILDTRYGLGGSKKPLGPKAQIVVAPPGTVADDATGSLAMNVTGLASANTDLVLYPWFQSDNSRPGVSALNVAGGQTAAVGYWPLVGFTDTQPNTFAIYNAAGNTNVVIDVAGSFEFDPNLANPASRPAATPHVRAASGSVYRS